MDHYEVRKYRAGTPITDKYVGAFFSVAPEAALGKKSACPHRVAAADDIGSRLTPADLYDCEVLALVAWVQQRNHQAYRAHRKRRQEGG